MKRKDFLKLMGLGASGALLGGEVVLNSKLLQPPNIIEPHTENIIIGGGYGSAVTSQRLCQAGKKVVLLERGLDWDKYNKANDKKFAKMDVVIDESKWLRKDGIAPFANNLQGSTNRFTGILQREEFDHVKIYIGCGLGGGSLVNGAMTVVPKRNYFEEIMPQLDAEAFYTKYFPLVNTELGMNTIPPEMYNSEWYKYARAGVEEGKNAGFPNVVDVPSVYDYNYMIREMKNEVPRSALNQEVIYGNNYEGKKDLTKSYFKRAIATGNFDLRELHQVDLIKINSKGQYVLIVKQLNHKGHVSCIREFTCDKLFIGAGSVGTTELLLKSKALGGLPDLDNELGKYWGNNGNTMAARRGGMENNPADLKSRGVNQSTMPARGLDNFEDPVYPFFAEIAPFPGGVGGNLVFGDMATYLVVNKLKKFGSMEWDKMSNKLKLNWGVEENQHMRKNAKYFLDKMNQANGGTYATTAFPKDGIDESICYHPLGGCVIGKATDLHGRVNNYKNLYVMDGALIPGTLGVNPYVTITAVAEYCIETILKEDYK